MSPEEVLALLRLVAMLESQRYALATENAQLRAQLATPTPETPDA